jgi:putative ABC transport system permease protein
MDLRTLKRRWRALWHRDQLEQELDDELQFHLERDIAQNIESGMTPAEARSAALKSFGGLDQSKEQSRDARGVRLIENILQDVRYSSRLIIKTPVFTFVVLLTLALGIGANTAIFSFANGILLRPLPYPQSDRLVVIDETALKRGINSMSVSFPNYLDWREQNTVFENIGIYFGSNRFA